MASFLNAATLLARGLAGAILASAALIATPASANSAATADMTAPLRSAQSASGTKTPGGDEQFRSLFASWQSLDQRSGTSAGLAAVTAPTTATASIPSITPIQGFRLTSDYGMRVHPVLGGMRMHKGLDMASPVGTPVYATADGIVGKADWFGGYGLYVQIEHGGELETRYGHMSRLNVAAGQHVHKGDLIGFVGTTGRSTGPHLHYEVRVAGEAVNPLPYLQAGTFQSSFASAANLPAMDSVGGSD